MDDAASVRFDYFLLGVFVGLMVATAVFILGIVSVTG